MQVGTRVEVHTKLTNSWSSGFEVAEVRPGGYRLRRLSDGALLPDLTGAGDIRPAGAADVPVR